jgi:hypothetical protein
MSTEYYNAGRLVLFKQYWAQVTEELRQWAKWAIPRPKVLESYGTSFGQISISSKLYDVPDPRFSVSVI